MSVCSVIAFAWCFIAQEFAIERAMHISRLPNEPEASSPAAVQVLLRLPSGQRLERRFDDSDKLEVYNRTS